MNNLVHDPQQVIRLVVRVMAVGAMISSLETLKRRQFLTDGALMSWSVGRLRSAWLSTGLPGAVMDWLLRYPRILQVVVLRAVVSAMLIVAPATADFWPLAVLVAALTFLVTVRSPYGQNGADQLCWIFFAGLALVQVSSLTAARTTFLWFLALQSCLSYSVAGIAKLSARGWRDGTFLISILGTEVYGNRRLAKQVSAIPGLAKGLSLMLIAWETLFPLILILPSNVAPGFLAMGIVFHLVNAVAMGLNDFFWSFTAMYPATFFVVNNRGF